MTDRRTLLRASAVAAGAIGVGALSASPVFGQATPIPTMESCDPYAKLPPAPTFTITSTDFTDGEEMPETMRGDGAGQSVSPQLSWSGFPAETKGFVVTMFDADAPTPSGFWHWVVVDIPASTPELRSGAGAADSALLPAPALQMPNDVRTNEYIGPAPPSGVHRYFIAVSALDVPTIDVDHESTPAFLSFNMLGHTVARAVIVALATAPS